MIRRPPRATQGRSSAASDVYKRQRSNRGRRPTQLSALQATLTLTQRPVLCAGRRPATSGSAIEDVIVLVRRILHEEGSTFQYHVECCDRSLNDSCKLRCQRSFNNLD